MKVALIGAGNNGVAHLRSLAVVENITVVGIADPVLESAQALASEVGGEAFGDHRALLESIRPDAVWISSPPHLHAAHSIDCATSGAHVYCEKPMALTLEDCDQMIAAVGKHKVKLMVGQTTRYMQVPLELKRLYDSGRFGDLVNAWSIRQGYHKDSSRWRMQGDRSGGVVFEWEVHEIDFVRSIGGDVQSVYARTAFSRADAPTFMDHFSAIFTFRNGGYANLEASQSCAVNQDGRGFVGSKGAAQSDGRSGIRYRILDVEEPKVVEAPVDSGAARGLFHLPANVDFIRAIREDRPSPVSGKDARHNVEIGLAIIESGRTGSVIELPMQP